MSRVTFTFFGPSEGLEFHTIPQTESVSVGCPPAIASVFELTQQGVAIMVARVLNPERGAPMTWIGRYAQIFEKSLERQGHSFGVGFWFSSEIPSDIDLIIEALNTLHQALAQRCVSGGRFCDRKEFNDFVKYFEPKVTGFCEKMFPKWEAASYETGLSLGAGATAFYNLLNMENQETLSSRLAWCLWAPGATSFQKVVFAGSSAGDPSPSVIALNQLDRWSGQIYIDLKRKYDELCQVYSEIAEKHLAERGQLNSTFLELRKKIDKIESERRELEKKLEMARNPVRQPTELRPDSGKGVGASLSDMVTSEGRASDAVLATTTRIEKTLLKIRGDLSAGLESRDANLVLLNTFVVVLLLLIVGFGAFTVYKLWDFNDRSLVTKEDIKETHKDIKALKQEIIWLQKTRSFEAEKSIVEENGSQNRLRGNDVAPSLQTSKPQTQKKKAPPDNRIDLVPEKSTP